MTGMGTLDFALATLRHLPDAFLLLDQEGQVAFLNIKGEELLDVSLDEVRGKTARKILNLRDAHDIVHGETSATWINGGRLEFRASQYPVDKDTTWLHLALRFPSGKPSNTVTATRPQPRSEASFEYLRNGQHTQTEPEHDDFWSGRRLENILEKLPTLVAAVSKDGSHVYQNRMAFDLLGSVRWSQDGLTSWLEKQWGSTHGDGTPFAIEDYPIYKTAVLAQDVDDYETCFEDKSYLFGGAPQYDDDGNHLGGVVFAHDITDMKREGLEKERMALAQSETNFRAITDAMDQLVWTCSPTGEVQYLNRRWYEYTGAGRDASLGLGWFSFVHPDEVEATRAAWSMLMPDQDSLINSHRVRAFDGTYRTFLARARCIRDEEGNRVKWLGTSTDITELTEALEEAKSTREHLLSITSAANVHYWVIQEKNEELQMTSLLLSEESERQGLYGYLDRAVLLHRDVQHVFPETLVTKSRRILRGQQNRDADEILVNGEYWRTQLSPLKSGDGLSIVGVVGTAMNITQEKIKEQALQRADTARDVAIQSSTFKSEFLARMSHEIRTPIGGILGMAQLLSETSLDATQRNFLNGVLRSGDGLLVIINDILDFSKIEVGKLDIESLPFDLKLVAEDVIAGSRHGPHINPGVELKLNYEVPVDIVLLGDRNRVMQILYNLTSNALKFTKTGAVTINISTDHAQIFENGNSGSVVIVFEVIDTGVGIPQHVLSKLFTPFTQADSTTCRKFGGTGLGLTIARQLATLMSGTLGLASTGKDGEGSTAKCIIPFTLCPKSSLRRTSTLNEKIDGQGAEILLVEDNKINQTIAVNMLKKMNFTTRVANHGQEALDILHAGADGSYVPQLILMDCQMPVLDGYETTRLLRNDLISAIRQLPVIAMTASAIRGDKEKCLEAGMNDYLSKPVKQAQLGQIVAKWISEKAIDIAHLSITPPTIAAISKKRPRESSGTEVSLERT